MDPITLLILIIAILIVGGIGLAFLRRGGNHTQTIDPSSTDAADSVLTKPKPAVEATTETDQIDVTDDELVEEVEEVAVVEDDELVEEEELVVEPEAATFRDRLSKALSLIHI